VPGQSLLLPVVRTPSRHPAGRPAREKNTASCVFAASWCCSVGLSWTIELRPVDEGTLTGPAVEWICSGVPTQLPVPERQSADLLSERGLLLFPDDPAEPTPRARSRRLIGYVTRDPEMIALALKLADAVGTGPGHPMVLAARWVQAGYSPDAAASWVTSGVTRSEVADTGLST
jgi:hypothetical protein